MLRQNNRLLRMKVLILCTGNSCRSQMAEGFLRHLARGRAEICSAGLEAHGVNPLAIKAMAEIGIDLSSHRSELVDAYLGTGVTHVITVCDHAAQQCPYFPENVQFTHFSFPDPAKVQGNEAERMIEFRKVRDQIGSEMEAWAKANFPT
jgi:arsenate reductase (thioredoxin)